MKLTIEHNQTKVIVLEESNNDQNKDTCIRYDFKVIEKLIISTLEKIKELYPETD